MFVEPTRDVVVATVLPFLPAGAIDWESYRRLLEFCALPDGISTVFVNGHAGESASLTRKERIEVIEFTRDFLGGSRRLVAGVIPYSTQEAIDQARDAEDAGVDGVVLFPVPLFSLGGTRTPDVPLAYFRAVSEAVGCSLSVFQYPLASGLGYTTETLVEIAKLPRLEMIKEGSGDIAAYEDNWRAVKAVAPHVAIMPTNSSWFMSQVAVGADGILSGLASLTPHFLIELWRAAQRKDLDAMRAANDKLYPVVRTIYAATPRMDMHTRIKAGLRHLGVIDCAIPRPPLLPLSASVEQKVIRTVDAAGLAGFVPTAALEAG